MLPKLNILLSLIFTASVFIIFDIAVADLYLFPEENSEEAQSVM